MAPRLKILGIAAGPRKGGNSDTLLQRALLGAESLGARTEEIYLSDFQITPCTECNHCFAGGSCNVVDDFQPIIGKVLNADRIIFATPVFFMTVTAQAKLLIDRCQCLWVRHNRLHRPIVGRSGIDRLAAVIAVGGSRSRNMFDSVRWTMQTWLDTLGMKYTAGLFVNRIDELGAVLNHREALTHATRLGRRLADPASSAPDAPSNIVLE